MPRAYNQRSLSRGSPSRYRFALAKIPGMGRAILGLIFGAFVIWLVVRVIERRERWAITLSVILVAGMIAAVLIALSLPVAQNAYQMPVRTKP